MNTKPWSKAFLPLLLLASFVISVGVGLYALASLRDVLVGERGADLASTAVAVADTLDRVLFERFGDIQAFSNDAILRDGDLNEKAQRLLQYKKLYWYYSWIGITDASGRIIAATDLHVGQEKDLAKSSPEDNNATVNRRDWFDAVRRTGMAYFGDPQASRESGGTMAVTFSAPIHGRHGEFSGVVTSRVPLENLRAIIDKEGRFRYGNGEAYDWLLIDRQGVVLSDRSEAELRNINMLKLELPSAIRAAADRHKPGFVEELHSYRKVPVLTGYARTNGYSTFPGFDWTVLIRVDREHAYAPINRLVWMVAGAGLLVVTPIVGFAVWASWKLIRESEALFQTSQALQESVTDLKRSNADLQQFAYVASHDLQEPLRMVASYTQLLAKRYKGQLDSDADEFIGYAVDGANRMQRLINDLLAYSRVDTQGKAFEPTGSAQALEQALGNLRMMIEQQQAVVTHDSLPTVVADSTQLIQLFQNLIANAIKFRSEQLPSVHVSAARQGTEWLFSVRDNGIGIDPQYADRIFILFQRLHSRADYPGTGIGLAVCKKIVERHGGRIWMESQPGHGATFIFTLPFIPKYRTTGDKT